MQQWAYLFVRGVWWEGRCVPRWIGDEEVVAWHTATWSDVADYLGMEGWELVAVNWAPGERGDPLQMVFKQPLPVDEEAE